MPTKLRSLPGDFSGTRALDTALRVNHAGEYGATRIYAGQLAVLGKSPQAQVLHHMAAQEAAHLAAFNRILPAYGVRPSALMPLWHIGGWLMGAASAVLGPRAAMACTVAVESVITEHYDRQLADPTFPEALRPSIQTFRDEEQAHHDLGLAHEAESSPIYAPLSTAIRTICRAAIAISARV